MRWTTPCATTTTNFRLQISAPTAKLFRQVPNMAHCLFRLETVTTRLVSSIRVSLQGPGDDYICLPRAATTQVCQGTAPCTSNGCISTAYTCLDYYTIQCFSPYSSRDHLPAEQIPPGDLTDARRAARDRSMSAHVSSVMILPLGLHRDHQTQ